LEKKTENKTWFIIDAIRVKNKAQEYNLTPSLPPHKANLSNSSNITDSGWRDYGELDSAQELDSELIPNLSNSTQKPVAVESTELEKLEKLDNYGCIGEEKKEQHVNQENTPLDITGLKLDIQVWERQHNKPLTRQDVTSFTMWYCEKHPNSGLQPSEIKPHVEKILKLTPTTSTDNDEIKTWIKQVFEGFHKTAKTKTGLMSKKAQAAYNRGDVVTALAHEVISIRYAELGRLCDVAVGDVRDSEKLFDVVVSKVGEIAREWGVDVKCNLHTL